MNIKRAFLAAAAVLMVPGYAMAQTIDFDTTIQSTNLVDVSAHAWIECNTGNDLQQDQMISNQPDPGNGGVDFILTDMDYTNANTTCTVWFTDITAGYEVSYIQTNTGIAVTNETDPPQCQWYVVDPPATSYPLATSNNCNLFVQPKPFEYTMNKVFDDVPANSVSEYFQMDYTCYNVATLTVQTNSQTYYGGWSGDGDSSYTVDNLYTDPQGGDTYCVATENAFDSALESDQGCQNRVYFNAAGATGECTVTNTVFFEGIPTLSQAGLAILAVLMLGVGFVGFRRFV